MGLNVQSTPVSQLAGTPAMPAGAPRRAGAGGTAFSDVLAGRESSAEASGRGEEAEHTADRPAPAAASRAERPAATVTRGRQAPPARRADGTAAGPVDAAASAPVGEASGLAQAAPEPVRPEARGEADEEPNPIAGTAPAALVAGMLVRPPDLPPPALPGLPTSSVEPAAGDTPAGTIGPELSATPAGTSGPEPSTAPAARAPTASLPVDMLLACSPAVHSADQQAPGPAGALPQATGKAEGGHFLPTVSGEISVDAAPTAPALAIPELPPDRGEAAAASQGRDSPVESKPSADVRGNGGSAGNGSAWQASWRPHDVARQVLAAALSRDAGVSAGSSQPASSPPAGVSSSGDAGLAVTRAAGTTPGAGVTGRARATERSRTGLVAEWLDLAFGTESGADTAAAPVQAASDSSASGGARQQGSGNSLPGSRAAITQAPPGSSNAAAAAMASATAFSIAETASAAEPALVSGVGSSETSAADSPMARQVVRAISLAWHDNVGEAKVRLTPEHLGEVTVSLKVERGGVTALLQADTPAAREWIQAHEQDLRRGLEAQGLRLDALVVTPDGSSERRQDQPRRPQRRVRQAADAPRFEIEV
jgi:hypothetical protein